MSTAHPDTTADATVTPPRQDSARASAVDCWVLLVASALLLTIWSFVVPIYETPDEPHHWQFARYLHDERRLPVFGPDFVEANSPPLYYLMISPVARATAVPPPAVFTDATGRLTAPFGVRLLQNAGDDFDHYWPIRWARLLTVLMSIGTVWFAYQAGLEATGRAGTGLLAGALVAFLPQFTFRGMSVSNDALVTTMGAAFVWLLVRLVRRGYTTRLAILAGVTLALAYLSKINAIGLAPALGLLFLTEPGSWPGRIRRAAVLVVPLVLIAPWTMRNIALYGDPFASGVMLSAVAQIVDVKPIFSSYFVTVFPDMLGKSFVGLFGWMNVLMPKWVYWFYALLGAGAMAGLLARTRRLQDVRIIVLLAVAFAGTFAVVVHINRTFSQPQGRYLFPALAAAAVLVALGIERWPGWAPRNHALARCAAVLLAGLNVWVLVAVVWESYYPPLTPYLSTSVAALTAGPTHDLDAESDGSYVVVGRDSQISFGTSVDTSQYPFLRFQITGRAPSPDAVGAVYFAVDGQPSSEGHKLTFDWAPDGQPHLVTVPLAVNPLWKGRATVVRIDPINRSGGEGTWLRVDRIRLIGNLAEGR